MKTKLLDFTALVAWLIASAGMAFSALVLFGKDFNVYYAAARLISSGGNPYAYNQLATTLVSTTGSINNPFYYPPWFAWFVSPLTLLPYATARIVWVVLNLVIWLAGLYLLGKLIEWPAAGWRRFGMFLFVTYMFAWICWRYEQIGTILFTLLVAALWAIEQKKWVLAGICLALCLFKPQITLLPVLAACLWFLRKKQWKPIVSFALVTIGLTLACTLATPDWYQPLLQPELSTGLGAEFDKYGQISAIRINTTLLDWLTGLGIVGIWHTAIYAIVAIAGLTILSVVAIRSTKLVSIVSVALLVSFATTPYALQYDYPLLTLPLFVASARAFSSKWIRAGILVATASVLVWERPISDGYWMVIGQIVLLIWSWKRPLTPAIPEQRPSSKFAGQ